MLVMTIQKNVVAERILDTVNGVYLGDITKSNYAYLSPRYTLGYNNFNVLLNQKRKLWVNCPIFGWAGSPCVESIDYVSNRCAIFLDVPTEYCVFSDYDKYCDYLEGTCRFSECLIDEGTALWESAKGSCIQVCMGWIDPKWILDYSPLIPRGVYVDDCLRYCQVTNAYLGVKSGIKLGSESGIILEDRKSAQLLSMYYGLYDLYGIFRYILVN